MVHKTLDILCSCWFPLSLTRSGLLSMIFVLSLVLKTLLKKEQQGFICLVENECVRVKNQEKCRFGSCKQPKLAFPDHQSKACRRASPETCLQRAENVRCL